MDDFDDVMDDWDVDEDYNRKTRVITLTSLCEGFSASGKMKGGWLDVSEIEWWGEASGSFDADMQDALKHSTGTLVAVRVWEGGDSIDRLTVKDGAVKVEKVEL